MIFIGASFAEAGSPIVVGYDEVRGERSEARGSRGASLSAWVAAAAMMPVDQGTPAIVLEMGGNTVWANSGECTAAVMEADRRLRAAGWVPTWVVPPEWPPESPNVIRARRQLARAGIQAASVNKLESGWAPTMLDLSADGVHLRRPGALAFGRAIAVAGPARAKNMLRTALIVTGVVVAGAVAWKAFKK